MLILASQSPRRRELLGLMNLPFEIRVADIDETMDRTQSIEAAVAALSRRKAEAIERTEADVIIAADTIVVLDDKILGKPRDEKEARQMLYSLSGRAHRVMTGVTVLQGEKAVSHTEVTEVFFRPLTDGDIDRYLATGDYKDKAGAYGIQNGAALFVEKLNGDYFNVVGLPVCRLSQILEAFL